MKWFKMGSLQVVEISENYQADDKIRLFHSYEDSGRRGCRNHAIDPCRKVLINDSIHYKLFFVI